MWYVYVLQSNNYPFLYVGSTNDIERRFMEHNSGHVSSTKAYKPYALATYIAVPNEHNARILEKYFKKGSGKTILKKRILNDEDIAMYEVRSDT